MHWQRVLLASAAARGAVAVTASADVSPIGEFTGDAAEGFEGVQPPGGYPSLDLFGGTATMTNPFANTTLITFNFTNLTYDPDVVILPYNGNLFGAIPVGQVRYDFDAPVQRFGGFMTTSGPIDGTTPATLPIDVDFFDANGNLIESVATDFSVGQWEWRGWESTVPVAAVVFTGGNFPPGDAIMFDDLQRSLFVPEPASLGLAAVAGLGLLVRRRRA